MTLYFITGNKHKFAEVKKMIPSIERLEIDLPELQDIDPHEVVRAKLQAAFKHHDGTFIVEDTSLVFDCLDKLPGPFIKWFLKTLGRDGLADLVHKHENHSAYALCLLGYATSPEDIHFFEGRVDGSIVKARGDSDFGWDPIFLPNGSSFTYAESKGEEFLTHRQKAVLALKEFLEK